MMASGRMDSSGSALLPVARRALIGGIGACALVFAGCQALPEPFSSSDDVQARKALSGGAQLDAAIADYQSGDIRQALTETRRARETDPSLTGAYELEALLQADLGDREQHVAALRNAIAAHPSSAQIQSAAGRMLVEAGERE